MPRGYPRWIVAGLLVFLGLLVACLERPHAAQSPRTVTATVERVSDGDTVTAVTSNGTKLRLRLLGIDAPEIQHGKKPGQPFGEEARQYLDHLIGRKIVQVQTHGRDKYKRILAVIFDGQFNVNLMMVAMGHAEVYRGAPCQAYCEDLYRAEVKARWDKVGMWTQGPRYESPGDFRRKMRLAGG